MKRQFVKNTNALNFKVYITKMEKRGPQEAGLLLVTGRPGDGKTTTLYNYAGSVNAVMLTAAVDSTPRRLMVELAEKLGIEVARNFEREIEETIARNKTTIILDEAGFALSNSAACIEKLRGITDKTLTLLVMVIMKHDMSKLNQPRLKQLADRIGDICEFKKASLEDVQLACTQLGEVAMAPELVAHIHRSTDASMRQVLNAICRVEETAARRPEAQRGDIMTLADVKGVTLSNDFGLAMRKMNGRAGS
jgi:nucleoside-triphosphatase THEP1